MSAAHWYTIVLVSLCISTCKSLSRLTTVGQSRHALTYLRIGFRPFIFSRRGGQSFRGPVALSNIIDDSGQLQNSLSIMTLGWSCEYCHYEQ